MTLTRGASGSKLVDPLHSIGQEKCPTETRDHIETLIIHDDIKDVEEGHVRYEHKDIYKTEEDLTQYTPRPAAHQPDYSGKLWDSGNAKFPSDEPLEILSDKPLPTEWADDLNDPNVKGEGGDRLLYEAKHLQDSMDGSDGKQGGDKSISSERAKHHGYPNTGGKSGKGSERFSEHLRDSVDMSKSVGSKK